MFFNGWYKENKELKRENEYFARECWLKEERYRNLNKKYKELQEENEQLKEKINKLQEPKRGRGRPRKENYD